MKPVVFLDRDGTLNEEVGYIRELTNLNLISGAGEAVRRLNEAGVAAILITNQTGAARGYYDEEHIVQLNRRLESLLAKQNARLDGSYYCPHLEGAPVEHLAIKCDCRKPETGLVDRAYREIPGLSRDLSYVVGDKATDVELAKNCGARGVLVRTGYGEAVTKGEYQWKVTPDFEAGNIVDAVDWILRDIKARSCSGVNA